MPPLLSRATGSKTNKNLSTHLLVPARGIAPRSADQSILLSGCRVSPIARSSVGLTPSAIGLGLQALGALTLSSNLSLTLSSAVSLAVSSIVSSTISSPLLITRRGCVSSLPLCIIVALISICQRTLSTAPQVGYQPRLWLGYRSTLSPDSPEA